MISKKSTFKINDLMMYVAVAVEHLRLMVLLLCLSLTAGLVYYCFARPVYYSQSLVRLHALPQPLDSQEVFHDSSRAAIMSMLESDAILERTAKKFGQNEPAKVLRKLYVKKVRAKPNNEGNIVLEVWPYSISWANDFPEEMVKQCIQYRDEGRRAWLHNVVTTYNTEIATMRQELDKSVSGRMEFSESNDLARVQIKLDGLQSIPIKLQLLNNHIETMDSIRTRLGQTDDAVEKLSILSSVERDGLLSRYREMSLQLGNPVGTDGVAGGSGHGSGVVIIPSDLPRGDYAWEKLSRDAQGLEAEIAAQTRAGYMPGNKRIKVPVRELALVRKQIDVALVGQMRHFNMEYDNLKSEQKELEKKLPDFEEASRSLSRLRNEGSMYDGEQLSWGKMIMEMKKRLNLIDFAVGKEHVIVIYGGLLEPVKNVPDSPNRFHVASLSVMFGLALAISIPFLLAYLDNSVSDVEHVEEVLRIRGLGVVPKVADASINNLLVANINAKPAARPEYHLQENFRIIRTNLIMNSADPALPQVILITSAMPQEGKTVVAANLAMSFAIKGEKTLLVDGDLRRGRLHRLFNCQNKPGLSDVLSKYNSLSEACRPSGNENLTIMTCGKHLNWASELLDSPGYAKVIEELRSQYQRIIIDTPPVLGLSETSIMQRLCDGVLMVIWSNATQMPNVKDAISALQTNGARFCGFVLNRLDFTAFANRYKYFYYSPRYYTNYKAIESGPLGAEG